MSAPNPYDSWFLASEEAERAIHEFDMATSARMRMRYRARTIVRRIFRRNGV